MKSLFLTGFLFIVFVPLYCFSDEIIPADSEDLNGFDKRIANQYKMQNIDQNKAMTQKQNRFQKRLANKNENVGDENSLDKAEGDVIRERTRTRDRQQLRTKEKAEEKQFDEFVSGEAKKIKAQKKGLELGEGNMVREKTRTRQQLRNSGSTTGISNQAGYSGGDTGGMQQMREKGAGSTTAPGPNNQGGESGGYGRRSQGN